MHGGSFRHFFEETSLINKWIIMKTLGHIDGIICLSDYWRKFFDELTNARKFVIPNSVRVFDENKYNVLTDGIVFLGFIEQKKAFSCQGGMDSTMWSRLSIREVRRKKRM
jgi:hypothetical protein